VTAPDRGGPRRVEPVPLSGPTELAGFRFARLVDGFDGERPRPWAARPWIADLAERDRILGYLESGAPVVERDVWAADLFEPARGPVVPTSFRTDGSWIWSDASAYHLRTRGLAPEPDFLAHIAAAGYRPPPVDEARRQAAVAAYRQRVVLMADRHSDYRRERDRAEQRETTPFTLVRGELSNEPPTVASDPDLFEAMLDGTYERFPQDVEDTLVSAGWLPGRNASARVEPWLAAFTARAVDGRRHEPFPAAEQVLAEFGLLDVEQVGFGEPEPLRSFHFLPLDAWIDPWDYARFSRSLGRRVFPVALVDDTGSLVVDEVGQVFLVAEFDTFFVGGNVDAALVALIRGYPLAPVVDGRWESDPRG
jgi:hypothetical protein